MKAQRAKADVRALGKTGRLWTVEVTGPEASRIVEALTTLGGAVFSAEITELALRFGEVVRLDDRRQQRRDTFLKILERNPTLSSRVARERAALEAPHGNQ